MAVARRSKWMVVFALFLILMGARRIVEWSIYGQTISGGGPMPDAVGRHALVTGFVVVVCGAWILFFELWRKANSSPRLDALTKIEGPATTSELPAGHAAAGVTGYFAAFAMMLSIVSLIFGFLFLTSDVLTGGGFLLGGGVGGAVSFLALRWGSRRMR